MNAMQPDNSALSLIYTLGLGFCAHGQTTDENKLIAHDDETDSSLPISQYIIKHTKQMNKQRGVSKALGLHALTARFFSFWVKPDILRKMADLWHCHIEMRLYVPSIETIHNFVPL